LSAIEVKFKRLMQGAKIPEYETKGAAGCDISIPLTREMILFPFEVTSVSTGFAVQIPENFEAQIRSRAGMARKGIVVANAPATIDSEHTGEIKLLLLNVTDKPVKIYPDQKVAQMVLSPVIKASFVEE